MMLESAGGETRQQSFVIESKNATRKRLRVRRLKYTCQTKIQVVPGSDRKQGTGDRRHENENSKLKKEEKDVGGSSMKIVSVSFSSSVNDVVFSSSSGGGLDEKRKTSGECLGALMRGGYGVVSVKGRRKEMEDAVRAEVGFGVNGSMCGKFDFYGVYDGHGGPDVARACRDRMHEVVAEGLEMERINGEEEVDWERVMEGCFGTMDGEVSDIVGTRTMGSTALVAVVTEEEVVVANCGDCRAVLSRGGVALALSNDHKPDRVDELKRIEDAGGRVINWNGNRVLGVLATSRSIGDQYLRPYVISKPEVRATKRRDMDDEFLILASDGVWDVVSSELACQVVNKCLHGRIRRISKHKEDRVESSSHLTSEAAAVLADLALARGSKDNISVIVVDLANQPS